MDFRHEWKHLIGYGDLLVLRSRLSAAMQLDPHARGGSYRIRSLYFDNVYDRALREKIESVNHREKFRIRLYNCDSSFIHLEKKSKVNGLCNKQQTVLTPAEVEALVAGRTESFESLGGPFGDALADASGNPFGGAAGGPFAVSDRPLLAELLWKMRSQVLRPATIVDYIREPFVYAPGNVRVTLDYDIRTGMRCTDVLDPSCVTVPVRGRPIVLEVKWDEYLPTFVRDLVQVPSTRSTAFSKYAASRMYL